MISNLQTSKTAKAVRTTLIPLFLTLSVPLSGLAPQAIAVDLLWTDGKILRAPIDGSGPIVEIFGIDDYPGAPERIAPRDVTVLGNSILWVDSRTDQILHGPLDGSGPVTSLYDSLDGLSSPRGLVIDGGFLYVADRLTNQILRGSLDGVAPLTELFGPADVGIPSSLAISGDFLYWPDTFDNQILRGRLDGEGTVTVLFDETDYPSYDSDHNPTPQGIAISGDNIFWTDIIADMVLHGSIDGTGPVSEVYNNSDYPGLPTRISPRGIIARDDFLYWADNGTDSDQILMAPSDGSGPVTELYTSQSPQWLAIRDSGGDFDFDGRADGRDFLAWQRGESPNPLSASDLTEWQANYGAVGSFGGMLAVPEPNSGVLTCLAGLIFLGCRTLGRISPLTEPLATTPLKAVCARQCVIYDSRVGGGDSLKGELSTHRFTTEAPG